MFPVVSVLGSFWNCLLCADIIRIHLLCIRFEEQNLRLIKSQEFTIFEKQNDVSWTDNLKQNVHVVSQE